MSTTSQTLKTFISENSSAQLEFDSGKMTQALMRMKFAENLLEHPVQVDVAAIVRFIDCLGNTHSCKATLSSRGSADGYIETEVEGEEKHSFFIKIPSSSFVKLMSEPVEPIQEFLGGVMESLTQEIMTRLESHGDTSETCQRVGLINAVNEVEHLINGITEEDITK